MADVRLNTILITSDREHDSAVGRMRPGNAQTLFSGISFSGISLEHRMGSPADDAISGRPFGQEVSEGFFSLFGRLGPALKKDRRAFYGR